jgi:ornithine cyclodeaminase
VAARTEFVYLSEPDTIEAGVLDAERCIEVCDEVFRLLAAGDYLMGGANHNSHGLGLVFPKEPAFANMPAAGMFGNAGSLGNTSPRPWLLWFAPPMR